MVYSVTEQIELYPSYSSVKLPGKETAVDAPLIRKIQIEYKYSTGFFQKKKPKSVKYNLFLHDLSYIGKKDEELYGNQVELNKYFIQKSYEINNTNKKEITSLNVESLDKEGNQQHSKYLFEFTSGELSIESTMDDKDGKGFNSAQQMCRNFQLFKNRSVFFKVK
jgi:hypothetical protein